MANNKPVRTETNSQGCWLVVSHKLNHDGYFRKMFRDGKARLYHRVIYEDFYGAIPDGYEVDHICRQRNCCNPMHLQLLTKEEHLDKTNRERYRSRYDEARDFWEATGCTGTLLGQQFGVSTSAACKWIKAWKVQPKEE